MKKILFVLVFSACFMSAQALDDSCEFLESGSGQYAVNHAKVRNAGKLIVDLKLVRCKDKYLGVVALFNYATLEQIPAHISKLYLKIYEPSLSHYYAYVDTKKVDKKYKAYFSTYFEVPLKINNKKIMKMDIVGVDFSENIFIE
jgi:hypothetical protein